MCGIIGYIGASKAVPLLIRGLERLEYRGYDSSGIALVVKPDAPLVCVKEKGKLSRLKELLRPGEPGGTLGIGHTRWATHGVPSRLNAHPHLDVKREFAVVHNGIIENYAEIKAELIRKGYRFVSDTDTEVLVHLIRDNYSGDFLKAFLLSLRRLSGFFAFAAVSSRHPDRLLAFRRSNPLVIGLGRGENFVSSDVAPLLEHTRRVIYPEDNDIVELSRRGAKFYRLDSGCTVSRKPVRIKWSIAQAEKGGYPHFMLKEIHEQPRVVAETISKRVTSAGKVVFDTLHKKAEARLKKIRKIFAVSCGTAYHACMVSKYLIEDFVRLPVECWVSSEFRYSDPILTAEDVVVLISQSGETADTLAALREARSKGAYTIAICNVVGSTISRESDAVLYTHAGPEIGVASTKAYLAQLMSVVLFAFYLGRLRGQLGAEDLRRRLAELRGLPKDIEKILKLAPSIKRAAGRFCRFGNFLFLARGYNYPSALEGTLKLQEISYAHAHGYAAGEMKHGPIALIDSKLPVICLCPESATYEKMVSNIQEIKARGGIVIAVISELDGQVKRHADVVFEIPRVPEYLSPILTVVPLQLFAYFISVLKGCDVDQPRNLAKSVTVE